MDTVAVLTDQNVKPLLIVYLRSKESLNITGIKDGDYSLYFTIGDQWDGKAGRFSNVYGYYRYNTPLLFVTDDTGNKIEYSIFELDLYEAGKSNFMPDQFQFPTSALQSDGLHKFFGGRHSAYGPCMDQAHSRRKRSASGLDLGSSIYVSARRLRLNDTTELV